MLGARGACRTGAATVNVYQATLDRVPDAGGFEFWSDALAGSVSLASMTTGFVNSPEFQSTYGSLDNPQFVTLLYNNVLDRAPDAGGLAFWVSVLDGGASRASVVLGSRKARNLSPTPAQP